MFYGRKLTEQEFIPDLERKMKILEEEGFAEKFKLLEGKGFQDPLKAEALYYLYRNAVSIVINAYKSCGPRITKTKNILGQMIFELRDDTIFANKFDVFEQEAHNDGNK